MAVRSLGPLDMTTIAVHGAEFLVLIDLQPARVKYMFSSLCFIVAIAI